MPKFIENNPFRVLAIYSNASLKELIANKTRISAYAKVGKILTFPLDNAGQFEDVVRTTEAIKNADHELAMPRSKITYALFWFIKETKIDEIAISHYLNGNATKAKELLSKRISASSMVNLSVIGLIEGNYTVALHSIYTLVANSEECASFVATVCGETFSIKPFELWKIYIDVLLREKKASDLLSAMPIEFGGVERDYIKNKALDEPISILNSEIQRAQEQLKQNNPDIAYSAGLHLMNEATTQLPTVILLIGNTDLRYINIADALAKQILQCGINYYNTTNDDDDVDKAMVLLEYACTIAVGSLLSQRCRENLEILKQKKEERPDADIVFVVNSLKAFKSKHMSVDNARTLVNSCKPHLYSIASRLGVTNEFYIQASTAVANNALDMLVNVINDAQKNQVSVIDGTLKRNIDDALSVMSIIGGLTMNVQERRRFNENKATLSNMRDQVAQIDRTIRTHTPTYTGSGSSTSSSSGGCYIATMVYGDYDHPQVLILRDFRDNVLKKNVLGRAFIRFYYRYSPTWVKHLKNHTKINSFIRVLLDKFIKIYNNEKN